MDLVRPNSASGAERARAGPGTSPARSERLASSVTERAVGTREMLTAPSRSSAALGTRREFISVRQALADPGSALPDEYVGPEGIALLYRIAPLDVADVAWDDREEEAVTALVARWLP
jgi:hypothetical protein